jgi:hypothetical protein
MTRRAIPSWKHGAAAALALSLAGSGGAAIAQTPSTDSWTWRATLYGWLPSIHSTTQYDLSGGGNIGAETDNGGYLSHLKFAFMGSLEARRAQWSFLADAIYLNFGNVRSKVTSISGPGGAVSAPINVGTRGELRGGVLGLEAGYSIFQTPGAKADLMAGARYLRVKPKLDWELSGPTGGLATEGNVEATKDFFDGVVGVRGSADISGNWDLRYYADVGAGSSRFTWQALAGIGYRFDWGDVVLAYRHLAYDFHNDRPISDVKFSGPALAVGFKF